ASTLQLVERGEHLVRDLPPLEGPAPCVELFLAVRVADADHVEAQRGNTARRPTPRELDPHALRADAPHSPRVEQDDAQLYLVERHWLGQHAGQAATVEFELERRLTNHRLAHRQLDPLAGRRRRARGAIEKTGGRFE